MGGVGDVQDKIIKPSAYEIVIIIKIYIMPVTGVYETLNSIPSSMDDLSAHVLKYRPYLCSICVDLI